MCNRSNIYSRVPNNGRFGIIGGLETFPKINNRGVGIMERGGKKIFTSVSQREVKLTWVV